jgi:lipopolysaccharide assembly outer membrane protein LptD (OstA)
MRKILSLGLIFIFILIGWGLSSFLSKPIDLNIPVSIQEAGIFAEEIFLKGWEIRAKKLKADLQYKHFYFEGGIEGKVYRKEALSIDVKSDSAELDMENSILTFKKGVNFSTEDGYRGFAPYGVWYINTKEFICSNGRVKFEKIGEFTAEADYFRFSVKEGIATFEGNVVIETKI